MATTAAPGGAGSAPAAAPASASDGGCSLGVWVVILLIAAAIYYFAFGGGNQMAMYRSVMLGDKTFISADTGATATISETYKCFKYDPRYGYARSFLLADVDNDSKEEVVIELSEDDYRLVLDAQGSTVYGYLFSYRSMKVICADGSFAYSAGADNSGYAYASFNGRSCSTKRVSTYNYSSEKYFRTFTTSNIETYVQ